MGGNLLEDTMALTRSSDKSNLQLASGLIMFEKYEGCYGILYNKNNSAESLFTEVLQYKFPTTATLSGQARIVKKQDYVFSFVAKGSGNINVFLYGDSVHANVYTETCEGNEYDTTDGYAQLALTSTYKRYWLHWRINDYTGEGAEVIPDKVLIRVPGDTEAWVTKPKLEEGAQLTDYTERKTDLIDRATAKAAGLEITSSGVTLYGKKIKVENTLSTGQTTTAALFTDGAINAALILAQMLTSQGLNGQMVRIADGLINIYGKAGTANIRFGLNSSGQAVLSYYDDNGNFLYDLGPAGVASLSKTDAKITSAQYIKAEDAGLTTPLGENVDLPWVNTTKSWYTATKDNNYILFVKGATGKNDNPVLLLSTKGERKDSSRFGQRIGYPRPCECSRRKDVYEPHNGEEWCADKSCGRRVPYCGCQGLRQHKAGACHQEGTERDKAILLCTDSFL